MRTLKFLLIKEFKQIFRNKALLPMIFALPIIQLLIIPLAADYEIKNINIAVVDHDHSGYAADLIAKITASGYFRLLDYSDSFESAYRQMEADEADLILEIPQDFEKELVITGHQKVFIAVNAINGVKGSLGSNYLNNIISDFNQGITTELMQASSAGPMKKIEITSLNWYNPYLNYQVFMVPGILVLLVTMVGAYMCSLNIVKEKEVGTIEQINVTPIRKHHYILGKLIPFWIIGMFLFTVGFFVIARLVYGIIPLGNLFVLYGFLALYLIAMLGFGLLISTYSRTQQQAMSVVFFFMMIFVLMSGLFTSIDSMPDWAQLVAYCNPATYFIEVMRMVVLKGSQLSDIRLHFAVVTGFALLFNSWAIINYRKTS